MTKRKLFLFTAFLLAGISLLIQVGFVRAESKKPAKESLEDFLAGIAGKIKPSDLKAAAVRQKAALAAAKKRAAAKRTGRELLAGPFQPGPGDLPDYFTTPNWANSPPLRKFVDALPNLPLAKPDTQTFPGSDYYEIELRQFAQQMHSDLPATRLRGYVQVNNGTDLDSLSPTYLQNVLAPAPIQYLGPVIVAQKDRPVRIKFVNALPTGTNGKLFVPVDTSIMGSGPFEINYDPVTKEPAPTVTGDFAQNRATLHLHGGRTPWISDGTPHQWVTPAGEVTPYSKGVSVAYVPDMWFDATGALIPTCAELTACAEPGASTNPGPGAQTFYWTNQQSSRLMFYHDHAWGITRLNVYVGEAAGYLITDAAEQSLVNSGLVPADQIPLVIQDKTFVDPATIVTTDPTWEWGSQPWNGITGDPMTPVLGDLWWPHVYMPAQNPYNPDLSGINAMGRWHYGPWFWPPTPVCGSSPQAVPPLCVSAGPVPNPYYDCYIAGEPDLNNPGTFYAADGPCLNVGQPPENPGTPLPSWGAEAFLDTMVVNGAAFPTVNVDAKQYRLRILNAAHDRFLNLQFYQAVSKVGYTNPTIPPYDFVGTGPTDLTEVAMVPASANPLFPPLWPIDGREGGVPDPATRGPAFIQIASEGGFLPAPVLLPNQPVSWNLDPTMFNVGNVLQQADGGGTLFLGPAERADVIVDFTNFAGKTLILYNDAPTAFPALDPHYDYYTGAPDRTDMGGYTEVLPGVGPNIRTVMQIRVNGFGGSAPVDDYNPTTLANLENAFRSTATTSGVFAASQDPIIVGQQAYDSAYNTLFPATWPYWGLSRISDNSLSFKTVNPDGTISSPMTIPMKPKAIQDEMGETFDEFGRMSAKLGLEVPFANAAIATFALQNYVDPPTEVVNGSEMQIWKITHNGVDTHPIHFHLFDVQVINRVGWDGFIRRPDPNELGWKDTVRIAPLEDTIVALRPVTPSVPFPLPDSVRPLNPQTPIGSMMGFSQIDPLTGGRLATPNENVLFDFGWEYVWHCHILSHEENDMMRSIVFQMAPPAPSNLTAITGALGVDLSWTDNAASETGFTLQRSLDPLFPPLQTVSFTVNPSAPPEAFGVTITYNDATAAAGQYYYRVQAFSRNGVSGWSNIASVVAAPIIGASPTSLAFGNQQVFTTSGPRTVTISNSGSALLLLSGISITGANSADFARTTTCGANLSVGATCTISVTFTPSAIGARTASLVIASNDPVRPSLSVALSGTGTTPIAGVSPLSLNFGNQLLNTTGGAQVVTLSNSGNAPLIISSINLAGANAADFARTGTCPIGGAGLAALANCTINVTFTPTLMGARLASLVIASNDPVNPSLAVALSGTGILPIAGVSPTSLAFGNQLQNTTGAPQTVTLSNSGNTPLIISGISLAGPNPGDFGQTSTCPIGGLGLAALANCTIDVTFTPSAMGARAASLNIASNDPVNPSLPVPLSGTGIAPIAAIAPTSLAFGNQLLNTASAAQVITLSNTGTAPLIVNSIGFSGANAADFAQISTCPIGGAGLAALASCDINVTFTPAATGARSASLNIASNDPANPLRTAGLSGTGTVPVAIVAPTSLNFPLRLVGTTSPAQAVVLSNNGTAPLVINSIGITGLNAADFTQTNTCGTSLVEGTNCPIIVTFSPAAVGTRQASITISSSDPLRPTLLVPLSGTGGLLPAAPTALTATPSALSANPPTVSLAWVDNANNETGFTVQRAANASFTAGLTSFTVGVNVRNYSDAAVAENTTYYYRVRAFNTLGISGWSNTATVRTAGRLPLAPSNLRFVSSTRRTITIAWTDNANNEANFRVQRSSVGATGPWTYVVTLPANTTAYTDTGLGRNSTYWYRVRANNVYGFSSFSNVVSGRTQP